MVTKHHEALKYEVKDHLRENSPVAILIGLIYFTFRNRDQIFDNERVLDLDNWKALYVPLFAFILPLSIINEPVVKVYGKNASFVLGAFAGAILATVDAFVLSKYNINTARYSERFQGDMFKLYTFYIVLMSIIFRFVYPQINKIVNAIFDRLAKH